MKDVSDQHLTCRDGTWYYRRRVPKHLVGILGRTYVQHSLHTHDKKQAKKLREIEDVKSSALFAHAEGPQEAKTAKAEIFDLSPAKALELVRSYVEQTDQRFREQLLKDDPVTQRQRDDMLVETEMSISVLRDPNNPGAEQWITAVAGRLLNEAGLKPDEVVGPAYARIAELVRRGLLEVARRQLATYGDQFDRTFFDDLFDPNRPAPLTFKELADQYFASEIEDAEVNGLAQKWMDKVRAHVGLARELIGDATLVSQIDYDMCLVRRQH